MNKIRALVAAGLSALVMMTTACTESQVSGQAGSSSGGGGGTTTTGSGDVNKVVSTGPSLNFNNNTAGIVDVELNPVTLLPAMVYLDRSAPMSGGLTQGALKYAYVDTYGNWNIEVVDINYGTAACGLTGAFCVGAPSGVAAAMSVAAKVFDLAFSAAGNPVIAYAYGASNIGSKQMRYAERSSGGVWTIGLAGSYTGSNALGTNATTIAGVEPLRALTLKVDSADRPHILVNFISQSQHTTSVLKHMTRISSIWYETDPMTLGNPVAAASATITSTANVLGIGALQGDFEICQAASSSTSVTLVGVMAVHSSMMAVSTGSSMDPTAYKMSVNLSTGVATSLGAVSLLKGCGGSCFAIGTPASSNRAGQLIAMDSFSEGTSRRPVVAMTTNTGAGTFYWPVLCEGNLPTAATSWSTFSHINLIPDSLGRYGLDIKAAGAQLIATFSATAQGGVGSTLAVGAKMAPLTLATNTMWTLGGTFVNTTVDSDAALDYTTNIAAAYDTGSGSIYIGYGKLTPVTANTVYGGDIILASAWTTDVATVSGAGFAKDVVDQTSFVASTLNAFPMLNAARVSGSGGKVGAAFYYADPSSAIGGAVGAGDTKLYYISRGGTAAAPSFAMQPVVNFIESTTATTLGTGLSPSIAYDANSQPAIAYHNGNVLSASLNVARTANDGANWAISIVDDTSGTTGMYPSIQSVSVSGTNSLGVAYYDVTNSALKFARYTAQGGWRRFMVDGDTGATGTGCSTTADAGSFSRLAFTSTGRPAIAYQRDSRLYVAYASEALSSATYTWTCRWVDQSANTRGQGIAFVLTSANLPHIAHLDMSGLGSLRYVTSTSDIATAIGTGDAAFDKEMVAATGNTVSFIGTPSIAVTSAGKRFISYYSAVSGGLVLASKASGAGSWTTAVLEAAPTGGSYSAFSGQYASMVLNDNSLPLIFYRSKENWLRYFSRESE